MRNKILIVLYILSIIIVFIIFSNMYNEINYTQSYIDKLVQGNLQESLNGFNLKYNEMVIEDKEYEYTKAKVGIQTAMQLLPLTSYRNNHELHNAIIVLNNYMIENSPLKTNVNYNINKEIYDLINGIISNLNSKDKALELKEYIFQLD